MDEDRKTPPEDFLIEEYRERHLWLRHWNTEQRLVALAIVSLNGVALMNVTYALSVVPALMILIGIFGIVHNNRLCARYDRNGRRLFEIADGQSGIQAVFQENQNAWPDHKWYDPLTMRAWFYYLYIGTILLWVGIALS